MNSLNVFNQMPSTKAESMEFARQIKDIIINGEVNPLEFSIHLKAIENFIEAITKDKEVKEIVLEEAEKEGAKSFEKLNAKISICEAGVKYSYSDSQLDTMNIRKLKLDTEIKARQQMLKELKETILDQKTGEILLVPASKKSTTIVKITL